MAIWIYALFGAFGAFCVFGALDFDAFSAFGAFGAFDFDAFGASGSLGACLRPNIDQGARPGP